MHTPDPDRQVALTAAVAFHTGSPVDEIAVLNTAEDFLAWLRGPAVIRLLAGTVSNQSTGVPTGTLIEGASVQIHDNEKFDVTAVADDAKGFATADTVTFTPSDPTVFTLTPSATDPMTSTVVAGVPGSAVLTVSDGTLSATLAVDVVPAGAATIALTEGPVTLQP